MAYCVRRSRSLAPLSAWRANDIQPVPTLSGLCYTKSGPLKMFLFGRLCMLKRAAHLLSLMAFPTCTIVGPRGTGTFGVEESLFMAYNKLPVLSTYPSYLSSEHICHFAYLLSTPYCRFLPRWLNLSSSHSSIEHTPSISLPIYTLSSTTSISATLHS